MYDGLKKLEVPRRARRGRHRLLKISGIGLLVFLLGVCGFGGYVYFHINGKLAGTHPDRPIANLVTSVPDGPINILIVGSDQRSVVSGKERELRQFRNGGGARTDTIMLLHIAAKAQHAVLVSFPRDLWVNVPGHGQNRINATFSKGLYRDGGRDLLIKTVEQLSGLPVNHYVEINFASFQNIVDAVGGVSIYFPKPVADKKSGLDITQAGCIKLNGLMALSFVRARYIYPTADLGRIQSQQRFIRAVLAKAKGAIFNPTKILSVSDKILEGLITDKGVSMGLALGIARKLSDQSKLDFRVFPGHTSSNSPYVFPDPQHDREFFTALKNDQPLPDFGKTAASLPTASDVSIKILNGSGQTGWAATNEHKLNKAGFNVVGIGTSSTVAQTTITYSAGSQLKAQLLAKRYPYAHVAQAAGGLNEDVLLILGPDSLPTSTTASSTPTATAKPKPVTSTAPKELGAVCG